MTTVFRPKRAFPTSIYLPKPVKDFKSLIPVFREARGINWLDHEECVVAQMSSSSALLAKSVCSWSMVLKSVEEYNSPKLDLLPNNLVPSSVTLLSKWSLKFTALLR